MKRPKRSITMDCHYLSEDIISHILSYLSVKHVLRFRCVSKSWASLTSDRCFILDHLNNSKGNRTHLLVPRGMQREGYIVDDFLVESMVDNGDVDGSRRRPRTITYPNPLRPGSDVVSGDQLVIGTCNGLVCVITGAPGFKLSLRGQRHYLRMTRDRISRDHYKVMALWNPTTREHKTYVTRGFPEQNIRFVQGHGFGYDSSRDEYKTVLIVPNALLVFSFSTCSWRRIHSELPYSFMTRTGFLLERKLHWVATYRDMDMILSVDLSESATCQRLPLPSFMGDQCIFALIIGRLGEHLCLYCNDGQNDGFWVMKEYGNEHSWSKLFWSEMLPLPMVPYFWLTENGEQGLRFGEHGQLVLSDFKRGEFEYEDVQLGIEKIITCNKRCTALFVESLASLP